MKPKNKQLIEKIAKIEESQYIKLTKWLYDNHRDVLREWEDSQDAKIRMEFA